MMQAIPALPSVPKIRLVDSFIGMNQVLPEESPHKILHMEELPHIVGLNKNPRVFSRDCRLRIADVD